MPKAKRTAHYVVSTHWDREWYQSFQGYRFRLVALLDELIDRMQRDPGFRYFQLDGQSIPVEDYLEVRPEREPEIRELTESGRLRLGPWYVLPDEFLVSGESLIRNLRMGIETSSRFGRPSRVGFLCDMFGHMSQMPQILRGFAIDNALVWRGVNHSTHGGMFRWRSPDGSEVLAYRFSPNDGYCHYAAGVRECFKPLAVPDVDGCARRLVELANFEGRRIPTPSILIFDGGDHIEIEPLTGEILAKAEAVNREFEFVHSHLDGFVEDLREQQEHVTAVFTGELRDPAEVGDRTWLIPGTLSSRIHLKQANARCENELCLWAEPFSTFAAALGVPYPHGYLRVAWRHLLQNHAHDSICGCSIDQVHKDMEYRFDQAERLGRLVAGAALDAIADRVRMPEVGERDLALVVFNPSADPVDGPVDLTVSFPADTDAVFKEFFAFEDKIGFRLFDPDGTELPYQYVAHRRDRISFRRMLRKFPEVDRRHEVDICTHLRIPAFGYTTLLCRPAAPDEPTRHLGSMAAGDHVIENEHLQVSAGCNGTISILDKDSGQVYRNLLLVEDRADIGDGWYHGIAVNDEVYTSIGSSADVALAGDGLYRSTLVIRLTMNVPECFRFDRMTRSDVRRPLAVTHHVTLRRGARDVEVRTVVENTIRDHRVRLLFPSEARTDTCLADGAFDVLRRPIALRADNARYKELEVETRPQASWTAVYDDRRGLAVVSTGLPESAVRDLPDRPIALTLLRSFIKAVLTSGNEGGQIQGTHTFAFRIVPLTGAPDVTRLCRMGQQLAAGLRVVRRDHRDLHGPATVQRPERTLPPRHGFLQVSGDVVVTAVQHARREEGPSVRMFNPTDRATQVRVAPARAPAKAQLVNLEGAAGDTLPVKDGAVPLEVRPRQIVTVRWSS